MDAMIPAALADRKRWVCWIVTERNGKDTKLPVSARNPDDEIDVTNPHRADLETARETAERHEKVAGMGFVFDADGPVAGVDLDDCREPVTGELESWAVEIVNRLNSFTEVSPSGTGLHVYALGSIPDGGSKGDNVEMYDGKRYFTVTGQHLDGTPRTVRRADKALVAIHREYITDTGNDTAATADRESHTNGSVDPYEESPSDSGNDLTDGDVIALALDADDPKFRRLWRGDTSGYPTPSEADLGLCCKLAFYTAKDPDQMNRLFRKSGLYRKKWDRQDYRERTLAKAIRYTSSTYNGQERADVGPPGDTSGKADGGRPQVSHGLLNSVYDTLRESGPLGTSDVAAAVDYHRDSERQVLTALQHLESWGRVEYERSGRSGDWRVVGPNT